MLIQTIFDKFFEAVFNIVERILQTCFLGSISSWIDLHFQIIKHLAIFFKVIYLVVKYEIQIKQSRLYTSPNYSFFYSYDRYIRAIKHLMAHTVLVEEWLSAMISMQELKPMQP